MDEKTHAFKKKLKNENKKGLVLDIDETLSWTIGHWVEQMQQLFGNPEGLSVKELVKKYRYTQNVPYWQTEEAIQWMVNAILSNEFQEKLPLVENAHHFVQRINEIIPIIGYITVRPVDVMSGTRNWLKKHDFPEKEIIAKPMNIQRIEGTKWKAEVLSNLYPEVLGIVDDNPGLIEYLPSDYQGTIYLYDYDETTRNDIRIYPCKTWEDIYTKIKMQYSQ